MAEKPQFIKDIIKLLKITGKGDPEAIYDKISDMEYEESQFKTAEQPAVFKTATMFMSGMSLLIQLSNRFNIQYMEEVSFQLAETLSLHAAITYRDEKPDEIPERLRTQIIITQEVVIKLFDDLIESGLEKMTFSEMSMVVCSKVTILTAISILKASMLEVPLRSGKVSEEGNDKV